MLITADELRKDALSCYGNEAVRTPHLDRLAERAVLFQRAYAPSPWCLPSRCALLTGLYPHNSGAYSNFRKCRLDEGIPNLFQVLKSGGYTTSVHGKCHFAPVPYGETKPDVTLPYDAFRHYYLSLGIDHLDLQDDKQVSVWFYDDYAKELDQAGYLAAYRKATWDRSKRKVFPFPGPAEWHPDSWVGRKAAEYIRSYDRPDPLFCWVSFSGPHYPFDPPKSYFDRVDMSKDEPRALLLGEFDDERKIHYRSYHGDGRGIADGSFSAPDFAQKHFDDAYWHELRKSYYANVALIDDWIGVVLAEAYARFGDDLLVIFTADHGEMLGNHGIWGKGDCAYEDVLNVPLLVRSPGQREGLMTEALVMLTDVTATCVRAAGLPPVPTDGRDLLDSARSGGHPYILSEGEGFVAVSDGRMKYVHIRKGNREHAELFDLQLDPHEFQNVIDRPEYARQLADLRQAIIDRWIPKLLA